MGRAIISHVDATKRASAGGGEGRAWSRQHSAASFSVCCCVRGGVDVLSHNHAPVTNAARGHNKLPMRPPALWHAS